MKTTAASPSIQHFNKFEPGGKGGEEKGALGGAFAFLKAVGRTE